MRTLLLGLAVLDVVLLAPAAGAAVDLNGPWRLDVDPDILNPSFSCIVQVTQSGSTLGVDGSSCLVPFSVSGTIDTTTGVFSASGTSDPLLCPTFSVAGTASPANDFFSGSFTCTGGPIPQTGGFVGGLCGNGTLDTGEDCDEGGGTPSGCCSDQCEFLPSTFVCGPTNGACVTGRCDGAGACVLTPVKANTPCGTDGLDCTDDRCDAAGICLHVPRPAGSSCVGDANPCTDGACDGGTGCVLTSNTASCDDGNDCTTGDVCAGGTCTPGAPAAAGTECEADGDLCSLDSCDAGGACVFSGTCSDCCAGCIAQAASCKGPTVPGAKIDLRSARTGTPRVGFVLKRGEATAVGEFGSPTSTTGYTLCVYHEPTTGTELAYRAGIPAGGTCGTQPCWRATGHVGFSYKDVARTPDGILTLKLKAGAAGKTSVLVKGTGPNVRVPFLGDGAGGGLQSPVTVQLRSSAGPCWDASFATPSATGPYEYRAKGGE